MSIERILAHVTKQENGCWIWAGAMDKTNPMLRVSQPKRKLVSARRYAYEAYNQVSVPSEFVVTSVVCKDSKCVNPAHLAAIKRGTHGHRLIGSWKIEHCERGHEFSEWNTGYQNSGKRFCIACDKNHAKEYAAKRRTEIPEYVKKVRIERATKLRDWVKAQKTACSICGESDPICLDFHHKDASQKKFTIASEAGNMAIPKLMEEIAKCNLLCSNCHRKLHAKERAI